jgi:hypothetical protein
MHGTACRIDKMRIFSKYRILVAFNILVVFVYALRSLTEPDIWWQMRTGQWIWEHGEVPVKDVLSYTYQGDPWFNVKWLSEVLYFLIGNYIDPTAINILCGGIFCIILLSLMNRSRKHCKTYAFSVAMLLTGLIFSYRMNGRPEMFSYLLTALYCWIFYKAKDNVKWLYCIIPLQGLWANLHEGFGVGLIMVSIYVLDRWQIQKTGEIKTLFWVWLGVFIAVCINPRGTSLLGYALNIYGQLNENTYTSEMAGARDTLYWNFFTKLHLFLFVFIAFYLLMRWLREKKAVFIQYSVTEMILFCLFFYLGIKSSRNIVFFAIVAFPFLVDALEHYLPKAIKTHFILLVGCVVGVYIYIVSGKYYTQLNANNQFGISVHPEKTPIGAFDYLDKHGKGQKVFADFLSTNYGLWALRPNYQSYIDLRDLDVFPKAFFENCFRLYQQPDVLLKSGIKLWDLADSLDHFEFVLLLNNENFEGLHRYINSGMSNFELVYADPLASVYQRKTKAPFNGRVFQPYMFKENRLEWINTIFNPWYVTISNRSYEYDMYEQEVKKLLNI